MPVTRSSVKARTKVQSAEEESQTSSIQSKQNAEAEVSKDGDDGDMVGKLPKTVKEAASVTIEEDDAHLSTKTALLLLILIFLSSAIALGAVYYSFPHLNP